MFSFYGMGFGAGIVTERRGAFSLLGFQYRLRQSVIFLGHSVWGRLLPSFFNPETFVVTSTPDNSGKPGGLGLKPVENRKRGAKNKGLTFCAFLLFL